MNELVEINVDYDKLSNALTALSQIEQGTGHGVFVTAELMNHSRGKMYNNINHLHKKLMDIETSLLEIVKNTKTALCNAGVKFEDAEFKIIESFDSELLDVIKNENSTD